MTSLGSVIAVLALSTAPTSGASQVGENVVSRLFAATEKGAFLSYSWGEHWTHLRPDLRGFTGSLTRFVCLGPTVFAGGDDGIFRSDDFGENFAAVGGWPGGRVTRFLAARLFALEPTLFAGTERGLYRSTNGGREWARVGEGAVATRINDIVWPGPEMFVATDEGLYRSVDAFESFVRLQGGLPAAPVLALATSQFFALDPVVFVGTAGKGLYRSVDGGETFAAVGDPALTALSVPDVFWWGSLLIVGTEQGLFLSNDGGENFEAVAALEGRSVRSILVPGAEEANWRSDIIVGTDAGVFKSSDAGASFRLVVEGMGAPLVHDLATFPPPPQDRERR